MFNTTMRLMKKCWGKMVNSRMGRRSISHSFGKMTRSVAMILVHADPGKSINSVTEN
jgi:hypothetical protein